MKKLWLFGSLVLVAIMVIVGGLTRLTESGLSMVDWRLIMGIIPPLSQADWQSLFDVYKQFPEYQKINSTMTLSEFKIIFLWEYIHRILGRLTGLWFVLGTVILWFKQYFSNKEKIASLVSCFLVIAQGALGWYMVKSGLLLQATVSHFRLASHLGLAFLLFGFMAFWYISLKDKYSFRVSMSQKLISFSLLFILFAQIIYGAFMAGLDAGHLYGTYPKMGDVWAPNSIWMLNGVINNFISNPFMIHFIHRWLAFICLALIFIWGHLNRELLFQHKLMGRFGIFLSLIAFQILLGIGVIVMKVPIVLAAAHQFLGLLIWAAAIYMLSPFVKLSFFKKMS